jgi:hypothetical protein
MRIGSTRLRETEFNCFCNWINRGHYLAEGIVGGRC